MYCLLKASHKEHEQLIGDSIVQLKQGQLATGRNAISAATGLTPQNVKTAISKLKTLGILTSKPTNKYSIISIVNWDCHQQDNQQVTNSQPASNQQVTTNKNVKNEKNGKNINTLFCESVIEKYNEILFELPSVKVLSDARISHIKGCIKQFNKSEHDFESLETWEKLFSYVGKSDFLMGRTKESFCANFDWITKKANMIKIVEGNYE